MVLISNEQLREILPYIQMARSGKKLTLEDQRLDYASDVVIEASNYMLAENEYEQVNALCAIILLSFKVNDYFDEYFNDLIMCRTEIRRALVDDVLEDILHWNNIIMRKTPDSYDNFYNYITKIVEISATKLYDMGYEPYKCIVEALKDYCSRIGQWDEETGKWVEDIGPKAQAGWYNADYEHCKLQ